MKSWDTLSGKRTYFGKPGSTARLVAHDMEVEERLKAKSQKKKALVSEEQYDDEPFLPPERYKLTDEQLAEWMNENIKECGT